MAEFFAEFNASHINHTATLQETLEYIRMIEQVIHCSHEAGLVPNSLLELLEEALDHLNKFKKSWT
jgi:hypothetical protein